MVNIMATIKREINKTTTTKTAKKYTKKVVNSFKLDTKKMVLTLELPVEWNANHSVLKATQLEKVEGKEYQKMVFTDDKGNQVFLFKTGFNYEPVVKEVKAPTVSKKDMSKLSDEEQELLTLLLKKMSK